jgi:PAS domain S-box-containing protein
MLDGCRVSTHWQWCDVLQRRYKRLKVERDPIFIKQDKFYTTAGVTAGIDLSLALVEEDLGHAVAAAIARIMVLFVRRPGAQSQHSTLLAQQERIEDVRMRDLPVWVKAHLSRNLDVEDLANAAAMSPRTFMRQFKAQFNTTPARWVQSLRVEAAMQQLENRNTSLSKIARNTGFLDEQALRRAFLQQLGVTPKEYREKFAESIMHMDSIQGGNSSDRNTDIEDRNLDEEALRARELNLRQITETIPEMLWSSTPEGSIDYCNGRLLEFTGFAPAEVQGTEWIKLLHPDDVDRAVKAWSHCVKTGDPYRVEVRTLHAADQAYRWCVTRALPLVDSGGRIVKWHGTVVDMHDWKIAQEELRRTQAELAKVMSVATMNVLTASIAHEINQPLASLITNASISFRRLNDDPPNVDGARETVQRTIRDANRASDVVTRLRALFSKKEFTLETFDLNEVTTEVIALSLTDLQGNRIILQLELAANLPLITGDRVQLQQVTLNLLRNASDAMVGIEDRPRHLLVKTEQDGDNQARLSVQDAGCGVGPQEFERLFEPFYTKKSSGMGIGLSISRSIIERHNGRLWAEPNDGPGTTFSFSIPCSPDSSKDEAV